MSRLKTNRTVLLILLIVSGLVSCVKKEFKDVEGIEFGIEAEFGLPLAKGELVISEAFKPEEDSSLFIYPGEDGILHLIFKDNIDTLIIEELMSDLMGDQLLLNDSITLPRVSNGISISSPETYFNLHLDSVLQDQQVDSLRLNTGMIEFEFKTWKNYDSEFSIALPNLCDAAGNQIEVLNFIPTETSHIMAFNLENAILKINTSEESKGIFTVKLGYRIMGKSAGNDAPEPTVTFKMSNFDINSAYGKLGGYTVNLDPISLDLFSENTLGEQNVEIDLGEPEINLLFLNQFGFPFSFEFSQLGFIKDNIFEEIIGVPKSVYIEAPTLGNENEFTTNVLEIDPNSNLDILASRFPEKMIIDGKFEINPYDEGAYNYIREQDMLISRIEADIPLKFSLSQIELKDTASINLSSLDNIEENLDLFKLKTKVSNGFPFELRLQGYFGDENYTILDSLFAQPVYIQGAEETSVTELTFWVDKNNEQIRKLKSSKKLFINASFSTRGGNSGEIVDFYSSQNLSVEIIGFAKINL